MVPPKVRYCSLFAGVVLMVATAACGEPCRELSDQICGCMPSFRQQEECKQRVKAVAAQRPDKPGDAAGDAACQALFARCSCEALARGDLSACGLAVE